MVCLLLVLVHQWWNHWRMLLRMQPVLYFLGQRALHLQLKASHPRQHLLEKKKLKPPQLCQVLQQLLQLKPSQVLHQHQQKNPQLKLCQVLQQQWLPQLKPSQVLHQHQQKLPQLKLFQVLKHQQLLPQLAHRQPDFMQCYELTRRNTKTWMILWDRPCWLWGLLGPCLKRSFWMSWRTCTVRFFKVKWRNHHITRRKKVVDQYCYHRRLLKACHLLQRRNLTSPYA